MDVYELPLAHPKLVGYQIGHDYWIFAAQDFKPSYWLILKREGFSGDLFQASDELDQITWQLDDYEQLANIYRLEDIPPPDAWYKWDDWLRTDLEAFILAGRIQVFKVDEIVASHLNDYGHPIYSNPDTSENAHTPVIAQRNQLAETLGKDIMDRWVGKDKADRLHWDRSGLMRELDEVGDIGLAVYDVAADLVIGLKDIGSFAITAVKDTVTGVVELAFDVAVAHAAFTRKLVSGDFDGVKDDLLKLGVMTEEAIKKAFKNAQAFAASVEEGRKIFWNLTTDAKSRRLIFDYLDSVYQSIKYADSRVIGVKIVSVIGIEVLLALATAGAGNVARRLGQAAAKGAKLVKNASKIDRIGPFPVSAIDEIADLGRALDKPAVKTPEKPPMTIVPEDAPQKTKPEEIETSNKGIVARTAAEDRAHVSKLSDEAAEAEKRGDLKTRDAKIGEARLYLKQQVLDNPEIPPTQKPAALIERLDTSSPKDKAVFWSGDLDAAKDYAAKNNSVTLETTKGGRIVDSWDELTAEFPGWKGDPSPNSYDFWGGLSKQYAEEASGNINVVQSAERAAQGGGGIWKGVEYPALQDLQDEGIVGDITYHVVGQ